MRSAIVPAQVTTYEDKVTERLSITQLVLIMTPLFLGGLVYVGFPPLFAYANYKTVLIVTVAIICGSLAIRVKGKLLMMWLVLLLRYNVRPRFFVYNKNHLHMRRKYESTQKTREQQQKRRRLPNIPHLAVAEIVKAQKVITDPRAKFHLTTDKKGRMKVHVTEIK